MYGYHCAWGFHWFFGLLFIILVIWLIVRSQYHGYYHRWGNGPMWGNYPNSGSSKAMDILKERYAKGEISKEEFEEKKKDLLQ